MALRSKSWWAFLAVAILAVGAGFAVRRDATPIVDFRDVAGPSQDSSMKAPPLRVAVAAMISPETTQRYYEGLFRLLGERLGRETELVQRRSYAEVNGMVERREVDLAFVCAGPYVDGHARFGMEIVAVPMVGGETVYHSYTIVAADSPYRTFDDLRDRRFAFTDPKSNTGSLVPRYQLARRNETPETFFRETFFTYSHDTSIKAVADGLADGAAVDSLVWEFIEKTDPALRGRTRIVARSEPYGIPPLVVHPALDPEVKARLAEALLSIHRTAEGAAYLEQIHVDRFARGADSGYETVREMEKWIARNAK